MIIYRREILIEEIVRLLRDVESPQIIEIGAHDGKDTARFLESMPTCHVVAFEPDPRPMERLAGRFVNERRVTLQRCAVAAYTGETDWFASHGDTRTAACHNHDWDFSSSLHKPTGHLHRSREISFEPAGKVPCVALDELGLSADFMWIDCQGAQRDVVAGGRKTIDSARWIYIELHDQPLYDGEPTFDELCRLLPLHNPEVKFAENILFRRLDFDEDI